MSIVKSHKICGKFCANNTKQRKSRKAKKMTIKMGTKL